MSTMDFKHGLDTDVFLFSPFTQAHKGVLIGVDIADDQPQAPVPVSGFLQ